MRAASTLLLDPRETAADAPGAPVVCYHCGLAAPVQTRTSAMLGGVERSFCCAGCEAIAQAIHGAGLEHFYSQRQLPLAKPESEGAIDWAVYDLPAMQAGFVQERTDGGRAATLLLEGMTCPACAWLNEEHLGRQPGVREARVNYTTQRLQVVWNIEETKLSELLAAVAAIGYRATPCDRLREEAQRRDERRMGLLRLLVAGLGMMQVMMYAVPAYITEDGLAPEQEQLLHWASLVLTLPVVLFSAFPFYRGAWRDLRHGRAGMDVPVALGILATFLASAYATVHGGAVYFDSVSMFVFLLLVARQFEAGARAKAAQALEAVAKPLPRTCLRMIQTSLGWREETAPVAALASGDRVRVCAGEIIPADGEVMEGDSRVEEALLTGESWPVRKGPGDRVYAGSVNQQSVLDLRVVAVGEGTRLQAISRLLERALEAKPPLARLADHIALRFVAAQLAFAAIAGLVWTLIDAHQALPAVVAILVVSCPCALALATPLALAVAGGALARRGVLVTGEGALETLAKVTDVVFDKTGTLSEGRLRCVGVRPAADWDEARVLEIAGALERISRHPIARALGPYAKPGLAIDNPREFTGAGVEGEIQGESYRLGRPDWVAQWAGVAPTPLDEVAEGASIVVLARPGALLGVIALADAPRSDAAETVAGLRALGLRVHLLSGDATGTVAAFAAQTGIAEVRGGARPEDKLLYVSDLQAKGAVVAMVGDGVNDAPSLGQAQVSIAIGEGADLAKSAADLVLATNSPGALDYALYKARQCRAVVRENLAWALVYNLLALPAAAAGLLNPWLAALGMSLSSLLVVGNAARLARDTRRP